MSSSAIFDTVEAMRTRMLRALGDNQGVYVGPPISAEVGQAAASLFLFHCEVNSDLRNSDRVAAPPQNTMATHRGEILDALPLDLRVLISVFRTPDSSATSPNELESLGRIYQEFQTQPTLAEPSMKGQIVRVTPEPYPMEELSRVWGLFPQDVYRTSVVYLLSPVFVEANPSISGPAVEQRELRSGVLEEVAGA